ncbi:MAG: hypothetical protein R3318_06565 [Gammaproteobacteria bacterium]|nr:hypothetical protein [Gammaproteobacteria bacterium]
MSRVFLTAVLTMALTTTARAEWSVVVHTDIDTAVETRVAYTENEEGYSLEVYLDSNGAIRSRFSTNKVNLRFLPEICPTFQIDDRLVSNTSINEARCLSDRKWTEFVLGYVINQSVESGTLNAIKNGNEIIYRFPLEAGGYEETRFSLLGSSRALTVALGDLDVTVP